MTDLDLDLAYRGEGWGKVTDLALNIQPTHVESQARSVARWAYEQIKLRDLLIADLVQHEGAEGFSKTTHENLDKWEPFT